MYKTFTVRIPTYLPIIILFLTLTFYSTFVRDEYKFLAFYNLITIPSFCLIILVSVVSEIEGKSSLLHSKLVVNLGEESYALYISHAAFLGFFTFGLHRLGGTYQNTFAGEIITLTFLMAAITFARILHVSIEVPLQKFIRKILT
jgi:peptidoglycan/LPS O-acetylase OafA/YrhL